MEIAAIHLKNLRNGEHYQFHTEFNGLVIKHTATALGIETLYATYTHLLPDEYTALNVPGKSALTDNLTDADILRDTTYKGILDTVKAAHNHFDETKQAAAKRLLVVLDAYGNVADKPYDEETGALTKLTDELLNTYGNDLETLGIDTWVEKLQQQNNAFAALKKSRYSEDASKTQLVMKETRTKVDATYRAMVTRINALIIVNGDAAYQSFVNEINARIDAFNLILAQRQGRNTKDNTTPKTSTNQ